MGKGKILHEKRKNWPYCMAVNHPPEANLCVECSVPVQQGCFGGHETLGIGTGWK